MLAKAKGPQCTARGSPMRLMAIEPSTSSHDLRTFSCRCSKFSGTSLSAVAEADGAKNVELSASKGATSRSATLI